MSNNVSSTSGTSRTCSTENDDEERVRNEEMATRHAQKLINELTPGRVKESGKSDEGTELALRAFQKDNGLPPTGKADQETIAKLENAVRAKDQRAADEKVAEGPTFHSLAEALVGPVLAHPLSSIVSTGSALDLPNKTETLALGASYEIKAKLSGRVELGAAESGAAKMTHNGDGTYTLEMSADLAATAGIGAGVGLEASLAVGGKFTFTAKTKEEAVRLASLAGRACIQFSSVAGRALLAAGKRALSSADIRFMGDHCSAVTVRGTGAAKVAAEEGLTGTRMPNGSGAEASATGEATGSLTVKLDHGRVTDIVAEGEVRAVVEARAAIGPKDAPGSGFKVAGAAVSVGAGAGGEARLKLTQHFAVPPGATLGSLLVGKNGAVLGPEKLGALRSLQKTTVDAELLVETKVDANAVGIGVGVGTRTKFTMKNIGNPATVADRLLRLDVEGAAKALPSECAMLVHIATTTTAKALDVGGTVEGGGIKFSGKLQGTEVTESASYDDAGSPSVVLQRTGNLKPKAPAQAPKGAQNDTNLQDQRYAHVAG